VKRLRYYYCRIFLATATVTAILLIAEAGRKWH